MSGIDPMPHHTYIPQVAYTNKNVFEYTVYGILMNKF